MKNYRQKANWILAIGFCLFLIAVFARQMFPQVFFLKALSFTLEAALVGGIADWFAVTALFRRPLGFSFHTALIPRNRQKMIDAMADMVEKELISDQIIRAKLQSVDYSDYMIRYFEKKNGVQWLAQTLITWLCSLNPKHAASYLLKMIRLVMKDSRLNAWTYQVMAQANRDGKIDDLLDSGVNQLIFWVKEEKAKVFIKQLLVESFPSLKGGNSGLSSLANTALLATGVLDIEEAVEAIQEELRRLFKQMQEQEHPLRLLVKQRVEEMVFKIEEDVSYQEAIEYWKNEISEQLLCEDLLAEYIEKQLTNEDPGAPVNLLWAWLRDYMERYWISIKNNADIKIELNRYIMAVMTHLLQDKKNVIGAAVRSTLGSLNDEDLNQFVENKAGRELQWIRINGSVIGAIIGLILFNFLSFVYEPYIEPILMQWIGLF